MQYDINWNSSNETATLLLLLLLLLPLPDASASLLKWHMAVQVLTQSAAHGLTWRTPLQCASSSHCMSDATGKKLRGERLKEQLI